MDDKTKNQPNPPDEQDPFRLEFIELDYMRDEFHPVPRVFESTKETPVSNTSPIQRPGSDLPDFPVNPEMWEQLNKTFENSRTVDKSEKSRIDSKSEKPVSLSTGKVRSRYTVDNRLDAADAKSWKIIIERGSGRTYGFSMDEYGDWLKNQDASRKITVKCGNCEQDVEDNPFTGFQFCPFCGTKISILGDDIRRIRKVQESAIRESQQQAISNPRFLTYPLDIPGILISSLSPPKFELILANYNGMVAPLIALVMLLALIVIMFIESHLVVTRIYLIIATFIAVVLNIAATKKQMGVYKIVINHNGVTFIRVNSPTTFRFERIIEIRVSEEISMYGSIKQKNPVLVLLLAPVALCVYVLTSGLVNLYESLYDSGDPIKDEKDRIMSVLIKTRGSTVNLKINKSLHPDFSRFMGILIYMTKIESRGVKINEKAIFSAQRSSNAGIRAKNARIDAISLP